MNELVQFYPTILILTACGTALLAAYCWLPGASRTAFTGGAIMTTVAVWTFAYAFELHASSLPTALLWARVRSLATATVPTAWLILSLQFTGQQRWNHRWLLAALGLPTAAFYLLTLTNDLHGLVWAGASLRPAGPFMTLDLVTGPALWVFAVYSYALILAGVVVFARFIFQSNRVFRGFLGSVLAACLFPSLAGLHDLLHLAPYPTVRFAPLGLALSAILVALGLLRRKFGSILPLARGFILEGMEDAVIVLDNLNRIVDLNAVAVSLAGLEGPLTIGLPIGSVWPQLEPFLDASEPDEAVVHEIAFHLQGGQLYFDMRLSPLTDEAGEHLGHVMVLREITARKATERSLRESEERFALAAKGANDGLWDWDLRADKIYYSTRWIAMLDLDEDEISNSPQEWFLRVHPDDRQRLSAEMDDHVIGLTPHFESEYRMLHRDGHYRWMLSRGLAVRDEQGRAYRVAGSQTDITNLKTGEERLRHEAMHDALTGLPNRAYFLERLMRAMDRARRRPEDVFAVLFMDLDRFKVVNDSLGHLFGDELLIAVAQRLRNCLREIDCVSRLGGDEFVILLEPVHDASDALRTAERIQTRLKTPFKINEQMIFTGGSIGIALSSPAYRKAEEVLRDADIAMYHAKSRGAGGTALFDSSMHARAVALLDLETSLRRGLEDGEFVLYYQPIQSLADQRLVGFEALLRWQHPQRGLLAPADFLPVAEETGLIVPIGYWVIREACRQLRAWRDEVPEAAGLTVNVNLSGRQLRQPDLAERIQQALTAYELSPENLRLEMSESAVMQEPRETSHLLTRLRSLGIRIHIDDFGTRFSSLSILHDFPIDALKIDRSFILRMDGEGRNAQIVRTILTLARTLGIQAVAEGVETAVQLEQLEALNCGYAQGYMLSGPLEPGAAGQLLVTGGLIVTPAEPA